MKKMFLIIVSVLTAMMLTSCANDRLWITERYLMDIDYRELVRETDKQGASMFDFSVIDFEYDPVDTLYGIDVYGEGEEIVGYGYSFIESYVVIKDGEKTFTDIPKVIYILNDGTVYKCVNR